MLSQSGKHPVLNPCSLDLFNAFFLKAQKKVHFCLFLILSLVSSSVVLVDWFFTVCFNAVICSIKVVLDNCFSFLLSLSKDTNFRFLQSVSATKNSKASL